MLLLLLLSILPNILSVEDDNNSSDFSGNSTKSLSAVAEFADKLDDKNSVVNDSNKTITNTTGGPTLKNYTEAAVTAMDHLQSVTTTSSTVIASKIEEEKIDSTSIVPLKKKYRLHKCCDTDMIFMVYGNGTKTCGKPFNDWPHPLPKSFTPITYDNNVTSTTNGVDIKRGGRFPADDRYYEITIGFNCTEKSLVSDYILTVDGRFYSADSSNAYGKYCVDFLSSLKRIVGFICLDNDNSTQIADETSIARSIKTIGLRVSCAFCFLTFLVYAIVDKLRNMQGKVVMMQLLCLTVAYFELSCVTAYTDMNSEQCKWAAFMIQFAFLASFFWLNVMCFDLWWTFSGYRSFSGSVKEKETKKFILYSVYAWVFPTIIVAVTILAEFWPAMPAIFVRPNVGKLSCWFEGRKAKLFYFYGPTFLVLVTNIFMFVSTMLIIIRHKRETKVLKRSGSKRHSGESDQQRLLVYLKLFIVMGVNWMTEIVSWFLEGPQYLWYLPDIGNGLQGVLIFIIFVCKRRVFRLLHQKLCPGVSLGRDNSKSKSSRSTSVSSLNSTRINPKNSTRLAMSNVQDANRGDFAA